jgi:hypothetical protein
MFFNRIFFSPVKILGTRASSARSARDGFLSNQLSPRARWKRARNQVDIQAETISEMNALGKIDLLFRPA